LLNCSAVFLTRTILRYLLEFIMPVVNLKPTPIEGAKPLTAEEIEKHVTSYNQTPADL
jgi:hypothetical protein